MAPHAIRLKSVGESMRKKRKKGKGCPRSRRTAAFCVSTSAVGIPVLFRNHALAVEIQERLPILVAAGLQHVSIVLRFACPTWSQNGPPHGLAHMEKGPAGPE